MASTFTLPNADMNVPHYLNSHYSAYYNSTSHNTQSPPSSNSDSDTPSGLSPASPSTRTTLVNALPSHVLYQSRQLRPPKSPLYIPAALRPTEPPSKHSPPKHGLKAMGKSHNGPPTPPHSAEGDVDNTGSLQKLLGEGLVKSSMTRIVTDEWKELEDVQGIPTREHWKPDASTLTCDLASCPVTFTTFKRRHHCRRCGNIFCGIHTSHQVPLDQHARFHPEGQLARACECCWQDYKTWEMARKYRKDSKSAGSNDSDDATPTMEGSKGPIVTGSAPELSKNKNNKGNSQGMTVGSLSREWDWSTF